MQIQSVKYVMSAREYTVIITYLCLLVDSKVEEKLTEVSTVHNDCVCPGDIVMYECTVVGELGGISVWMGDFFHCSDDGKEIELVHSQFSTGPGGEASNTRTCNNGNVVGRIIRVGNGSYTSQLNVTLTSDILKSSIVCAYDNGADTRIVGTLSITQELVAIKNISWVSTFCQLSDMHFNWDTLPPDCSSACTHYNILASNCGTCPTTTNQTNVICTNVPTKDSMCEFSVQSSNCSRKLLNIIVTKTPRCPGENDSKIHILTVILPLTMLLLLLAVLGPLSLCIFRKKLLTDLCCQMSLHRHTEQEYDNFCGRKSQVEDDKKAIKIFDNILHGMYNHVELDNIQSEQETCRKCQDDNDTNAIKVFDNRLNGTYNLVELNIVQNKQMQESTQGGSIQDKLTLNNLFIRLQGRVSSHWYQFGLALGVPNGVLEHLKDYLEEDALVEVLDYWLKNHPFSQPTWQDIATALKKADLNVE